MATVNHISKSESQYRIYGAPTGVFDDYFDENRRVFMDGMSEDRKKFFDRTKTVRTMWHGEDAIRKARKALLKVDAHINREDVIQPLTTIESIQLARLKMQLAVLAHPEVNKRHKLTQISGYGFEFEVHGVDRHRHVMDGIVNFDEDGNESFEKILYVDGTDDDLKYTLNEQEDILDTYAFIDSHNWDEADLTSVF